ncbi:hypothetical protein KBC51_01800 [Candidatus Saccharibacteria bacterium]|nr:hypothetical protein [Candidatus Saccharibacteria bacterium]
MSKYSSFIFRSYSFDPVDQLATFTFSYDNEIIFTETITFNTKSNSYNSSQLDKALRNLFLMVGVSYYKAYLTPNIIIEPFKLSKNSAQFFSETYQQGLRELFYINQLPITKPVNFPYHESEKDGPLTSKLDTGFLVGVGGGKDSLVSIELIKEAGFNNIATWSMGHKSQLKPLVETIGLKHYFIDRKIDEQIVTLEDAYKGHIPLSAILASVGTVLSILTNKKDVVVSNEWSASEPTLFENGEPINHQYSKSIQFENKYQQLLSQNFDNSTRYYSLLRSLNEVQIAELFAKNGFDKYKDVFCSCNKAFRQNENKISWCGECAKCCFVFLAFSPFVDKNQLETVFSSNPLINSKNIQIYKDLLGLTKAKPFDCVGTVSESRWAFSQIKGIYPELQNSFMFNENVNNHLDTSATDSIPNDVKSKLNFSR